jgi:glucosamine 6-phosphate synthetase-like amidotransferase/phosphosugar isomerase protein
MCVWSAYTGKSTAAPIIWDSLKKIEGFWAGYYTGIATCCDGRIHSGKVLGSTEVWEEKFSLDDFPGCCGLIHSRTNSGGDERWGHPFVGSSGKVAVIAQGCAGVFKERSKTTFEKWGHEMLRQGKIFTSGIADLPKSYPVLDGVGMVHSAEVGVQAVEYCYEKWHDPLKAVKHVYSELNTEAASLFIFADHPGVICFSNSNQHIVYQKNQDGVYLSITTAGLPGNCGMELPCNSVGIITPDEIRIEKLHDRYETDMTLPAGTLTAAWEFIKANPGKSLASMADAALKPLFVPDTLNYRVGIAYRCLEALLNEGKIRVERRTVATSQGSTGCSFALYPVEK